MMNVIDNFRGEYSFLSNFYTTPVKFEGVTYPTSEHAYMASKTLDPKVRAMILNLPTPAKAKHEGKRIQLRHDWDDVREEMMLQVVRAKFSNPVMKRKLLETGDAFLIEGNTHGDRFWGMCLDTADQWDGLNKLGEILMQVRRELWDEE